MKPSPNKRSRGEQAPFFLPKLGWVRDDPTVNFTRWDSYVKHLVAKNELDHFAWCVTAV